MSLVGINFNPRRRELRVFGMACAVALVVLAVITARGHTGPGLPGALAIAATACAGLAVVWPQLFHWPYIILSVAAYPLGIVVSWVLLMAVYYMVLTPIGLLRRWLGHDTMRRPFEPQARTYWIKREPSPPRERYFRQW